MLARDQGGTIREALVNNKTGAMEDKRKHLDFIQAVISRLANNTFLLKGWSVTLVAALFALAARDSQRQFLLVAYLPVVVFWALDAYYLSLERSFRSMYDLVRVLDESAIDYSMDVKPDRAIPRNQWGNCFFGPSTAGFYIVLIAVMILVMIFI